MKKVLLTAVGCPGAPSIINLLKDHYELYGVDCDKEAVGFHLIKGRKVPHANNEMYSTEIVKTIFKQQYIEFILPMSTAELLPLAKNKEDWAKRLKCKILVSDYDKLGIAVNKCLLYDFFDSEDFIPDYCILNGKENVQEYIDFIKHYNKAFAKPCIGNGSRGLFKIVANIMSEISFNRKPQPWQIISISDFLNSFYFCNDMPSMLISEFIRGQEWSVDCVIDGGFFYGVSRVRDVIRSGICTRGHIRYNKDLLRISEYIIKALGLQYNINLQFIQHEDTGKYYLIEINPRVSGTITLSSQIVNLPLLALKLAGGDAEYIKKTKQEIKKRKFHRSSKDWMKMTRYYNEIFYK